MSLLKRIPVILMGLGLVVMPPHLPLAVMAQDVNSLNQESSRFPVVKSAKLEKNMGVPWSKPVRINDPFEGNYFAVFDKHHWGKGILGAEGERQVISLWSRNSIRLLFTDTTSQCTSVYDPNTKQTSSHCTDSDTTPSVQQLLLKIGEKVFTLNGQNNSFEVTDELASTLTNAPTENLNIRLILEGGEAVDSVIGKGTVSAWKVVYPSRSSDNPLKPTPPSSGNSFTEPTSTASQFTESSSNPKALIDEVWQIVKKNYVDSTFNKQNWEAVRQQYLNRTYASNEEAYQAIREMLSLLGDSFTRFMNPEEFKSMQVSDSNTVGIGVQLSQDNKTKDLVVISPIEDTPGFKAGILSGDVVVKIDGQSTQGVTPLEAVSRLRGPVGTPVSLTLRRGQRDIPLKITREPVEVRPVRYQTQASPAGKIGYIRLTQFSADVTTEVRQAIAALEQQQVAGYILDLRSNQGGLFLASIDIARMFLDEGTIVSMVSRKGERDVHQANKSALTNKPLVILVNDGSASASEILASALQDNQRATLVGTQTYGNNLIQSVRGLADGSGLAVTIAKWYPAKGQDIDSSGLTPDVVVELTEAQQQTMIRASALGTQADPQYSRALSVLTPLLQKAGR
ncbi:MAG TPA: S41 family peptidase [Coleofasciculaceae cyanobacterium]